MMASGFYKFQEDILRYAAKSVYAPNFTLKIEDHQSYSYPIEGWRYFESTEAAEQFFELNGQSQAEWVAFGSAVQLDPGINALLGTALQQAPALGMGLGVGLGKAADGDSRVFSQAWAAARSAGLVPAELLEAVVAMAGQFHLPSAFVEALEAPPPPTALGEEWQAPSGRLYRVVQLQGEDGQFLPDDPQTPQRESLGWVVVEP